MIDDFPALGSRVWWEGHGSFNCKREKSYKQAVIFKLRYLFFWEAQLQHLSWRLKCQTIQRNRNKSESLKEKMLRYICHGHQISSGAKSLTDNPHEGILYVIQHDS